jgi:exonuclease VII small subunit
VNVSNALAQLRETEIACREALTTARLALDDAATALEHGRQLRHRLAETLTEAGHHLVIEVGPNGRPEVCR